MGVQRFLLLVDQTPVAAPLTKYWTTHALKERGWTATMIAALLPRPDASRAAYVQLPGNALVKLYLRTRVEEVELSEEFLIEQERATRAKARRAHGAAPGAAEAVRTALPASLLLARALVPALRLAIELSGRPGVL